MESNVKKTSLKQRIIIFMIAIFLLASTIATYAFIVLAAQSDSKAAKATDEELTALQEEYSEKESEVNDYAATLSKKYYDTFKQYRSEVKGYNGATVNSEGLTTRDLKTGSGKTLELGDTDYFAYYIGFCADETIFDSSFNDNDNPTALSAPIYAGNGLIEGWNQGVVGMKIEGVRELSIPSELAYQEQEICGGKNSALKFIVMPVLDEKLSKLNDELTELTSKLTEAYYGSLSQ